jgi:hypothetical protein
MLEWFDDGRAFSSIGRWRVLRASGPAAAGTLNMSSTAVPRLWPQAIPTICATCSHARWAAKRATNSRSPSAAGTIVNCTVHATSARGGSKPALTRSGLPAGSGRRPTRWESGDLDEKQYLGQTALPSPPTQKTMKSAPPQRCRMKLAEEKCSRIVAMRRCNRTRRGHDVFPGIDLEIKRLSGFSAWRDGLGSSDLRNAG